MNQPLIKKFQKELNAGTVSLVLLSILDVAEEDLYGYQIAKQMEKSYAAQPVLKQGALYPVLRSMSANGLLSSRVVPSYSGPPRRYYQITELGREILAQWKSSWVATREFVDRMIQTEDQNNV